MTEITRELAVTLERVNGRAQQLILRDIGKELREHTFFFAFKLLTVRDRTNQLLSKDQ